MVLTLETADSPEHPNPWIGTSFSAPIVSGVVALVLSVNPELTAAEAVDIVLTNADMAAGASPLLRADLAVQAALETIECVPDCSGLECGADPVCGESCGTCGGGETCQGGQCTSGSCWPNCGDEVLIPASSFWMGCNEAVDDCYSDEYPYHEVYLDAYYIDRTEVTAAAYESCVTAGGCTAPAGSGSYSTYQKPGMEGHPVNYVTWFQAESYCAWAGKRLPTEAEWEKAARGTDGRKYPWGNEAATCDYAVMYDGGNGCGTGETWDVCSKSPAGDSPYGLCDMAGNVWEWVADWYDSDYYATSPANNPTGPNSGSGRVKRGGSFGGFGDVGDFLRVSNRGYGDPSYSVYDYGFRCARSE